MLRGSVQQFDPEEKYWSDELEQQEGKDYK
jgi:hypothetical protein